jgi:hypothetical protein
MPLPSYLRTFIGSADVILSRAAKADHSVWLADFTVILNCVSDWQVTTLRWGSMAANGLHPAGRASDG